MNIYLHVESSIRELDSKLLLAILAASRGHQVLISNLGGIIRGMSSGMLAPGIFHTKSLTPGNDKIIRHQKMIDSGFIITSIDEEGGLVDHGYEKFAGMIKTSPMAALVMGLFMLSLAGLPPFALFWGKLYIISSAVTAGYTFLALAMALNSAIAGYYYLKLIVYMFMKDPVDGMTANVYTANASLALKSILGFAAVGTIFAFTALNPLLEFITAFVYNSGY